MDKNGFFTVGGPEILTADLKLPSEYVKSKSDFTNKVQTITNFLANRDLRAIGLLHDKTKINPFSDFASSKKQPNIKINDAIIEQIKKYLVEMVVFGDSKACDKCKLFDKINDEFTLKNIYFGNSQ